MKNVNKKKNGLWAGLNKETGGRGGPNGAIKQFDYRICQKILWQSLEHGVDRGFFSFKVFFRPQAVGREAKQCSTIWVKNKKVIAKIWSKKNFFFWQNVGA